MSGFSQNKKDDAFPEMLRIWGCGITISLLDTMPLLKSLCISKKLVILTNMMIMPMRC